MKIIFSIILCSVLNNAFAQLHIGARAGVTFSDYGSPTEMETSLNQGIMFGIDVSGKLNYDLELHGSLEYIEKGYYHLICNTIYEKLETSFMEMPLLIGYKIPLAEKLKLQLKAGGYIAYWMTGKYKSEGYSSSSDEFDFGASNATRLDFGPSGGAQLDYLLLNGNLFGIDFRYDLGLADMEASENSGKNTNTSWVLGISYKFLIK